MDNHKTVNLRHPLTIGDKTVETVRLRRPIAGDLRGINLTDLIQMSTDAVCQVVTRVSDPLIPAGRFWELAPEDLMELSLEVVGFFGVSPQSPSE